MTGIDQVLSRHVVSVIAIWAVIYALDYWLYWTTRDGQGVEGQRR